MRPPQAPPPEPPLTLPPPVRVIHTKAPVRPAIRPHCESLSSQCLSFSPHTSDCCHRGVVALLLSPCELCQAAYKCGGAMSADRTHAGSRKHLTTIFRLQLRAHVEFDAHTHTRPLAVTHNRHADAYSKSFVHAHAPVHKTHTLCSTHIYIYYIYTSTAPLVHHQLSSFFIYPQQALCNTSVKESALCLPPTAPKYQQRRRR